MVSIILIKMTEKKHFELISIDCLNCGKESCFFFTCNASSVLYIRVVSEVIINMFDVLGHLGPHSMLSVESFQRNVVVYHSLKQGQV